MADNSTAGDWIAGTARRVAEGGMMAAGGYGMMHLGAAMETARGGALYYNAAGRLIRGAGKIVGPAGVLTIGAGIIHASGIASGSAKAEPAAGAKAAAVPATDPTAGERITSGVVGAGIARLAVSSVSGRFAPVVKAAATIGGAVAGAGSPIRMSTANAAEAPSPRPNAAPPPPSSGGIAGALEVGLGTATTVKAAQLLASPAARVAAGVLTKLALPITVATSAYSAVEGYRRDGMRGAALGVADNLTGGGVSMGLAYLNKGAEQKAATPAKPVAAPSAQSASAGARSESGNGRIAYTTTDGRSVDVTEAQARAYEQRRKS